MQSSTQYACPVPSSLPLRSSVEGEGFGLTNGAQPLRLRSRRSQPPSSIRGWSSSHKAVGPAVFESLLERDAQTLISVDPEVEEYGVQCHRLTYWTSDREGNRRRQYTPDLVLKMRDGKYVVVEVKAFGLANKAAWVEVEDHIRRAYREDHDADFIVLTEREIRQEPYLSNAKLMLAHRGHPAPEIELPLLEALESEQAPTSIRGLSDILGQLCVTYDQVFTTVMQCALAGKVELDAAHVYSASTRVWIGG